MNNRSWIILIHLQLEEDLLILSLGPTAGDSVVV